MLNYQRVNAKIIQHHPTIGFYVSTGADDLRQKPTAKYRFFPMGYRDIMGYRDLRFSDQPTSHFQALPKCGQVLNLDSSDSHIMEKTKTTQKAWASWIV